MPLKLRVANRGIRKESGAKMWNSIGGLCSMQEIKEGASVPGYNHALYMDR